MSIIVISSINMDVVSQVTTHPAPGETVTGENFTYSPGGKGANQAVAAARLGSQVRMVGCVGRDGFAETLLDFYTTENIDISAVTQSDEVPTGAAFVAVDAKAENVIYVSPGANDALTAVETSEVVINENDIVLATLESPVAVIDSLFARARSCGATTVLNAAPAKESGADLFPLTDYLIVNEIELAQFSGNEDVTSPESIKDARLQLEYAGTLITTLGANGVVAVNEVETVEQPVVSVVAQDTTGAGDCFCGAFVSALTEHKSLSECLLFATTAASVSVQRPGAATSMPYRNEL